MGLKKALKIIEAQREVIDNQEKINEIQSKIIKSLEKRIEELEALVKEKSVPAFVKKDIKKEPKLDTCLTCGEPVSDTQEIRERIIEDIEEPRTRNTKHLIHRCYCKKCDKLVEPEIKDALPNARFGLKLMMLVLILKLDSRIPSNKITSLLSSV